MSFTRQAKLEIIAGGTRRGVPSMAMALGMVLFARYGPEEISLLTTLFEVADSYAKSLRLLTAGTNSIGMKEMLKGSRQYWKVRLTNAGLRQTMLKAYPPGLVPAISNDDVPDFIAGAFLVCGSMTDPKKSYHLEFNASQPILARQLMDRLNTVLPKAKAAGRRGKQVVYYKECRQIEDLLTLMGASKASLDIIDVEITREVRNRANRATNCETANIDKQVGAALSQVEDIGLIYKTMGEEALSEPLRETARLRMEHQEASLRELMELSPTPVSRSGLHHRLAALAKLAAEIRESEGPGANLQA